MNGNIHEKQVIVGDVTRPATVDKSLKKNGFAADAAEVGRRLEVLEERLNALNPVTANNLGYDNSTSALKAVNIQSAIDEVSGKVADAVSEVDKGLETALKKIDGKMGDYLKAEDKPSGTYTGNSSAAERVIDIGGNGNALLIYAYGANTSSSSLVFVCPMGAFGHTRNGTMSYGSGSAQFENGKLTLKTYDAYLNKSDVEYHYQVL